MTGRVPMVSLERAAELGAEMGLPAPMATRSAFRTLANHPPTIAFDQPNSVDNFHPAAAVRSGGYRANFSAIIF